ncbi:MAG: DUF3575 domain-containing protein [Flavobacteriaceae bacterium]|nr:DUF3575 domain-containing protein [Flavobacteriaceae bacterium]
MKKLFFTLVILTSIYGNAQEKTEESLLKNELHFNALLPIAFKTFEVSYERILNDESSVGVSLLVGNEEYYFQKFALSPYYRKFFSRQQAAGFFVEGFMQVNSDHESHYSYDYDDYVEDQYTDVALGIGIGGKFITKSNFIGLINIGIARNLGNNSPEITGKGGISIGYRF